jgi:hypothetical protein
MTGCLPRLPERYAAYGLEDAMTPASHVGSSAFAVRLRSKADAPKRFYALALILE